MYPHCAASGLIPVVNATSSSPVEFQVKGSLSYGMVFMVLAIFLFWYRMRTAKIKT
jgi:hypothetical protein